MMFLELPVGKYGTLTTREGAEFRENNRLTRFYSLKLVE